jgi:hypothetical protein
MILGGRNNMKCKVRLTHTVELYVEGKSEDQIQDWLAQTTPEEAYLLAYENSYTVESDYSEEIICTVRDDAEVDYVIKEEY